MTRRKQDAPKRLKDLEDSERSEFWQCSADARLVVADSRTDDGDGEEDNSSDDETFLDVHVDVPSALPCVTDNGLVYKQCARSLQCVPRHDSTGDSSDNEQSDEYLCHISGLESAREICTTKASSAQEQHASDLPNVTARFRSSEALSVCDSYPNIQHRKKKHGSTSFTSPSPALTSAVVNPQMALVMSSLPVGRVCSKQNSTNHPQPCVTHFLLSTQDQQDDQPLDLSRKAARSASFSSTEETKSVVLRNRSCSDSIASTPLPTNVCSSLRSLQQRFGDDVPLHPSRKSAGRAIPLPANITRKSAVTHNGLWSVDDVPPSTGLIRSHPIPQEDSPEEYDQLDALAVLPASREESNRQASPVLGDESVADGWSKHTTHQCSCQNTFSTLYSLSLHLQETGHTPNSSKASSLADYPKLVRGQDMWLNQESEQTRRILRCIQCGESFKSLPLLTVHMMQTQHYTNIVNSDHGRRPHKCSTYCGRDMDQECIFKCKVCHEAFSDMGGLANHMVASGHHKKQLPHHLVNSATVPVDVSTTYRQGKRKRCFQDDNLPAAVTATNFTVASLLNYRRKQNGVPKSVAKESHSELQVNGESSSPETIPLGLVMCAVCGESVEFVCFSYHVRKCLRHKAEVIETLRNKLTIEEALLARSQGKLKPNYNLASTTHQQKDVFRDRASTGSESVSSDDQENGCAQSYEKSVPEYSSHLSLVVSPERSNSLPSSGLTQMGRPCASPRTKFSASPSARSCDSPRTKFSASPSSKSCDSPSARCSVSPESTTPSTKFTNSHEVPRKKWCSNGESRQEISKTNGSFMPKDDDNWPVKFNKLTVPSTTNQQLTTCVEYNHSDQDTINEGESYKLKSDQCHKDDHRHDSERDFISEASNKVEEKNGRLSPANHVMESTPGALDCTYSALHKLDLFSRGLQLSPPKRTLCLEATMPIYQPHKVAKKKESLPIKIRSLKSKSSIIKSPQNLSLSPLPHLTSESPNPSKFNAAFDIIDPNIEPHGTASAPSALEAMESFINKSFSAKPETCSPRLTSMFSPYRNCFPNPGSLLPHDRFMLDASNATTSHFAKFSRFFNVVPGIPVYSEMASSLAVEKMRAGANIRGWLDTSNPATVISLSDYPLGTFNDKIFAMGNGAIASNTITSFPSVRVPVALCKLEPPTDDATCQGDSSFKEKNVEVVSTFKKENHTISCSPEHSGPQKNHIDGNCPDPLTDEKQNTCHHSPDALFADKGHQFVSSADPLNAQKSHQFVSFADPLNAQKSHKFSNSPDLLTAQTIRHYPFRTAGQISAIKKAYCMDNSVLDGLCLEPVHSSSQTLPHTDPVGAELERNGGKQLWLHSGTVSSKRTDARLDYIQRRDELIMFVKSEIDEDDTMWEDDEMVTNEEKVTHDAEDNKNGVNLNYYEKIACVTDTDKRQGNMNYEKVTGAAVADNSKVYVNYEKVTGVAVADNSKVYVNYEKVTDAAEADNSIVNINYEEVTDTAKADNCKVNVNYEKSKVNIQLEKNNVKEEVEKSQVDMLVQNSKCNLQVEKVELTFETEVDKCKVNFETEINGFNVHVDESEVDKTVIESESSIDIEKQNQGEVILKAMEQNSKSGHLELCQDNCEHKLNIASTEAESGQDKFRQKLKREAWLDSTDAEKEINSCRNEHINKKDYAVEDDIQLEVRKAVFSKITCEDIETGSTNDRFCKKHFLESSRLNSCHSYKSDSQYEDELVELSAVMRKHSSAEQEMPLVGSTALFRVDNCHKCDDKLPDESGYILDVVVTDNEIDEHDEVTLDTSKRKIEKRKCKEVELNVENIEDNKVNNDENSLQNVNEVSMDNITYLENNENGIDHNECTSSRNCCENETKNHSVYNVQCDSLKKQRTIVRHVKEWHSSDKIDEDKSRSTDLTKSSAFVCRVAGSSIDQSKPFLQSMDESTNRSSENTEKILQLQNSVIKEECQYMQKSLQKKNNHRTTVQMKNSKCLSERSTILNANEMNRQKKRKSALDYLSSFVYSQALTTEHPLDNLQRLLATNDLAHLPTDHEAHLVDTPHNCCSSNITTHSIASRSGQTCGNCSTEDNEDDEACLTETGTTEAEIHGHRCGACRRRFASKGSFRYHLSRCHLSSAKKYSIKETFNHSPYVYLPLDHTAKLSKYYEISQKLPQEGK